MYRVEFILSVVEGLFCFGKSRAERQELVQWTNLANESGGARQTLLLCKVLTPSLFHEYNGTLIKLSDIGGKRNVCGMNIL